MDRKNVYVLVGGMFLVASAYTMLIPFLPLYLLEMGVPDSEITFWTGLVFSSCFFVAGVMAPLWGKLADTSGKKKMAVRASFLLGFSYFFMGLCDSPVQLVIARAFQGFANGFVAAAMTIISSSVKSEKLGVTLGFAQTALIVGGICGPMMGGTVSAVVGMRNSFYIGAAFLWIVCLAVFFLIKEPVMHETAEKQEKTSIAADLSYAFHNGRLRELLIITFVLQCTLLMIQPVTSLYVKDLLSEGKNVALIAGIIMSSGGIAGALTTAWWGKFGQTKGYYKALFLTLTAAGVITVLQAVPDHVIGFGICQFLAGCFIVGVNPSLSASMVKYTPESFRGRVFGLQNTAQQFGNMVGPLAVSAITVFSGLWHVYVIAGILQLLLGLELYRKHISKGER